MCNGAQQSYARESRITFHHLHNPLGLARRWLTDAWWLEVPEVKALHVLHKSVVLLRSWKRHIFWLLSHFSDVAWCDCSEVKAVVLWRESELKQHCGNCSAGPDPPCPAHDRDHGHLLHLSSMKREQVHPFQNTLFSLDAWCVWRGGLLLGVFIFADSIWASVSA